MVFYELQSVAKTCIISGMLLFNLFQFGYIVMLMQHQKMNRALPHIFFLVGLLMAIPFLAENLYNKNDIGLYLRLEHVIFFNLMLWGIYAYLLIGEYRRGHSILGKNAVKEAVDQLPAAICFFSLDGLPILCNMKMYSLAYDLLGKDLQTMSELRECLNVPNERVKMVSMGKETAFMLEDQTVWHFSGTDVQDFNGREYIQVVGTDVTRLYQLQKELENRNNELQEMLWKIQKVSENIADIVRSKEVLSAKERVHGKMGGALLAARQYISGQCGESNTQQLLSIWKETLQSLRNEIDPEEGRNAFDELIQIAKGIGVEIQIDGVMPMDAKCYEIVTCGLREMAINTVRHASGQRLFLKITYEKDRMKAVYTNDGTLPEADIIEGGGLSMLRKKVEQYGGSMQIQSKPRFSLQIIMKT